MNTDIKECEFAEFEKELTEPISQKIESPQTNFYLCCNIEDELPYFMTTVKPTPKQYSQ